MIKILSIGNSISEDASIYLHDMAKLAEIDTKVLNLRAENSTLEQHWQNIISDKAAYDSQLNGELREGKISVREAVEEDDWDIVVMQQASAESGIDISYYPYIKNLSAFIKKYAPNVRQYVHQTWAFEQDCAAEAFTAYNNDQKQMYRQIIYSCQGAARNIKSKIIPCGEIFQSLREQEGFLYEKGQQSLCREDGIHAHLVYGRYTLAAVWYEMLLDGNVMENYYLPPSQGKGVDQRLIDTIKRSIHGTVKR